MKLTIALANVSKFTIDIQEEQAKQKFKSIAISLIDSASTETIETAIKKVESNKLGDTRDDASKTVESEKYHAHRDLVIIKCPECGEQMSPLLDLANSEKVITCKKCKHDTKISVADLHKARTECTSCGQTSYFLTDGSLEEINCKECKSPVDLVFHEKKGMYLSPNLIR